VKRSVRRFVLRLAELGWLHNQVRQHCENAAASKTLGLIGQSLIAALRTELTEYYRLVAVLQSQVRFYHIILNRFSFVLMYQCLHLIIL
jgi:gamma-tubulin complex component 3